MSVRAQISTGCDPTLWDHVYHPARLVVIHPCISVTGTIDSEVPEKDGDIHIRLKVDPIFKPLMNATNKSRQRGCLVLEPICVRHPTQADAIPACQGFTNTLTVPKKGDRIKVKGSYVHDVEGGHGWMEIHPVTSFEPN